MRDNGPDGWTGVLTNGTRGGANWTDTWAQYVSPASGVVTVRDALPDVHLNASAYEPLGYLPRPCIVGGFIGDYCGWPLGTNHSIVDQGFNSFWNGSIYNSVLPGLPPSAGAGNATCLLQACPGYPPCNTTAPTTPMPHPCV